VQLPTIDSGRKVPRLYSLRSARRSRPQRRRGGPKRSRPRRAHGRSHRCSCPANRVGEFHGPAVLSGHRRPVLNVEPADRYTRSCRQGPLGPVPNSSAVMYQPAPGGGSGAGRRQSPLLPLLARINGWRRPAAPSQSQRAVRWGGEMLSAWYTSGNVFKTLPQACSHIVSFSLTADTD
jgi:hypothetical protein